MNPDLRYLKTYLQLAEARALITALLKDGDWPDVTEAREEAGKWLRENPPTPEEAKTALGAVLLGAKDE